MRKIEDVYNFASAASLNTYKEKKANSIAARQHYIER